jgi:hypothetical protein
MASKHTTPPIEIQASVPISFEPLDTLMMTNIKIKVNINSIINV